LTETPTFTAVIPAFNAEETLAAAIRSVVAQSRQDFELIVVDDGSTDETAALARSFEVDTRVRVVSHENRGLPGARNTGIELARGRYIGLLDSDDLWMPTYLEAMGVALEADPGAGFAYTDGWALDDESGRIRRTTSMARQRPPSDPPRAPQDFLRLLVRRNFIEAAATIRKSTLEEVGPFNPTLRAAEDFELWLRILAHGHRAVKAEGLLLVRRDSATQMSKDETRMLVALLEVWRLVAEEHPAPAEVKAIARERMAWAERELRIAEGRHPLLGARRRARRRLGRLRRRLAGRRRWHAEIPPEVARAFPDLDRG
jgi:glycosyltransferase involved in cell wall biosynthesis